MKKISRLVLLFLFLMNIVKADTEPANNAVAGADNITLNGNAVGSIGVGDNNDYYHLTTNANGNITVLLTNNNNGFCFLYLYDSDGTTQLGTIAGGPQAGISFTVNGLAAGSYYILVNSTAATSNYTLTNTLSVPAISNDAEPNDAAATALTISQNGSKTGHIGYRNNDGSIDNNDFYKLVTTVDGNITVTLTNSNAFNWIYLMDNDGVTQLGTLAGNGLSGLTFTVNGLAAGTYYIIVNTNVNSNFSAYTISNTVTPTAFANDAEQNDYFKTALTITPNGSKNGHIGHRYNGGAIDNYDYYQLVTTIDGNITVTVSNPANAFTWIYLFDKDSVTQLGIIANPAGSGISFTVNGLGAGTYYIRVFTNINSNFSGYTVSNTITPSGIANDVELNDIPATALTLNQNDSAKGHIGYRYNGGTIDNNDYYKLVTTTDGNITIKLVNDINAFNWVYLYDSDGTTQLGIVTGSAGNGISFTVNGLAAGTYYVLVFTNINSNYSGYTIKDTLTSPLIINDTEPNDIPASAGTILQNDSVKGHIGYRKNGGTIDNYDYYKLVTTTDGNITVSLTNDINGFNWVYLYDNDGTTQLGIATGSAGNGISFTVNGLAAGTYYLLVYTNINGNYGPYTLKNTVTPAPEINDAEDNSTFANATLLNHDPNKSGHLAYRYNGGSLDNSDYRIVRMYTTGSMNIDVSFDIPGNFHWVYLYNPAQSQIFLNSSTAPVININFPSLAAGDYYLLVYTNINSSYNSYTIPTFQVPCDPAASAITATGVTTFCQGGSVGLNITPQIYYSSYLWSNGATTANITATANGSYVVTATDIEGCTHVSNTIPVTVNALPAIPVITANGPITFCQGGTVQLSSSVENNYAWSTGVTTQNINVNTNGTFTVTVTNTNNCSRTSLPTTVTVNALPAIPTITPNGPITFCQGGSVQLSSSVENKYAWSTGVTTQNINVNSNGTFTVIVTNINNCSRTSLPTTVTVNPLPNVTLSPFAAKCSTDPAFALIGGLPAGGTYSGPGVSGGQFNPSTVGAGSYTITYSYSDANTCSGTATQNISVTNCGGCTPTITPTGATTFCQGGSVLLTSSVGNSYVWSTGATTQAITATTNGTYTVTVTNANNCTGSTSTLVTVNALPAIPVITPNGPITFCQGGTVQLSSSVENNYAWSTGVTTQNINVNTNGTFTVTVTNTNNCSRTSLPTTVTVNPLPAIPTITPNGPLSFCQGGSVQLSSSVENKYAWSTGVTTQNINVNTNGTFTVTVTNTNNCSRTSLPTTVTVNPLPNVTLSSFATKCSTDPAFALTGGSPAGGTYSGPGVSGGQFSPSSVGAGTYTITYSYSDVNTCSGTATQTISVTNCGGCTPTITPTGATTFCQGGSVLLTSSVGNSYVWSTGATTQAITANTNGTYTVTVTNANNCTGSSSIVVTVNPKPAASISGTTTICNGSSTTLISSAGASYLWNTGATSAFITISPNSTTSYTVTVTYVGGCSSTANASVTVNTCNGNYCASAGATKTKGYINKVKLNTINNSSGWNNGYGNFISLSTGLNKNKNYTITITPGYQNCSVSLLYAKVWIDLNQDGDFTDAGELVFAPCFPSIFAQIGCIKIPNSAISGTTRMRVAMKYGGAPSCCGTFTYGEVEDYSIVIGTGNARFGDYESDQSMPEFSVYPNPASDQITIHHVSDAGFEMDRYDLIVSDLSGRIVYSDQIREAEQKVDVSLLENGIYMVQLHGGENDFIYKIVVSH